MSGFFRRWRAELRELKRRRIVEFRAFRRVIRSRVVFPERKLNIVFLVSALAFQPGARKQSAHHQTKVVLQVHNILNAASEIGADLHTLSHRLHSSTLERLGLVPGITALCGEFMVQQGITVDFHADDVPRSVHPDVALCLFRIVQEGLRNLKKPSGAIKAQVRLRRVGHKLLVTVSDEGIEFNAHDLSGKESLGIRSMEERVYFLGGRFEIHANTGKGTRIEASAPLQPKSEQPIGGVLH